MLTVPCCTTPACCRRSKGGASAISSLVLVVALVLCGGLSLMLVSTRTQMRDTRLHHEALQEELTYSKNHVQHVEVSRRERWGVVCVWGGGEGGSDTDAARVPPPTRLACVVSNCLSDTCRNTHHTGRACRQDRRVPALAAGGE
jgi:hypothetical protein